MIELGDIGEERLESRTDSLRFGGVGVLDSEATLASAGDRVPSAFELFRTPPETLSNVFFCRSISIKEYSSLRIPTRS